jgi:hypothetical protein
MWREGGGCGGRMDVEGEWWMWLFTLVMVVWLLMLKTMSSL